jgi:hypothetical protein
MSSNIRQPADDQAWLKRVTAALDAVRALHQIVSREKGNTARLIWQMRCLQQARSAWMAGDRGRARQQLAAAMNPDDGQPSGNGQASEHSAAGPAAQKATAEHTEADGSQSTHDYGGQPAAPPVPSQAL